MLAFLKLSNMISFQSLKWEARSYRTESALHSMQPCAYGMTLVICDVGIVALQFPSLGALGHQQ